MMLDGEVNIDANLASADWLKNMDELRLHVPEGKSLEEWLKENGWNIKDLPVTTREEGSGGTIEED